VVAKVEYLDGGERFRIFVWPGSCNTACRACGVGVYNHRRTSSVQHHANTKIVDAGRHLDCDREREAMGSRRTGNR
ncbi:hypothetical protein K438DRAFT_1847475, partial [Mycena galopus ATCC 62051]